MKGFTLIEVIVALVVLQVAVVGVLGTALIASRTMRAAEAIALRARAASSILDSLRVDGRPGPGGALRSGVQIEWIIDDVGALDLTATTPDSAVLRVRTLVVLP